MTIKAYQFVRVTLNINRRREAALRTWVAPTKTVTIC